MAIKSGVYETADWVTFGLKTDPFPARVVEPGAQSVFTQQEVFSLCDVVKPLQVFTGVVGVGKTTHAKQLAKHFLKNKRRPTQIITASKTIKASGLLKMICCRFNIELPPGDAVDSVKIDSIRRMVLKRKEAIALIVDDAQNLSQDALSALIRLTALQQEPLKLQVVLFGMPILLDRTRKAWGEAGVKNDFGQGLIRSWGSSQTEAYIISRLQESGVVSSRKICRKACQKIHQLSGGVPMQINRRANMMLDQLIKGHSKRPPAAAAVMNGRLLWMGALLSAITACYFSYEAMTAPTPWEVEQPVNFVAYETEAELTPVSMESTLLQEAMVASDTAITEEFEVDEVSAVSPSIGDDLVVAPEADIDALLSEVSIEAETQEQPDSPQATAVESEWIDQDGYTIQVMATTDEAEANRVSAKYDGSHVVHASRQNTEKYLVVVGQFGSISEANASVATMEAPNGAPWVRNLSKIREDVAQLEAPQ